MAIIVMAEGEINDITEIRIDDKVVTWASAIYQMDTQK
jgi:hypothetical protein